MGSSYEADISFKLKQYKSFWDHYTKWVSPQETKRYNTILGNYSKWVSAVTVNMIMEYLIEYYPQPFSGRNFGEDMCITSTLL